MSESNLVFVNGCFDILHAGHFYLLSIARGCKGLNGQVVVAIDSDEKIKRDKGEDRPFFSFEERRHTLLSLSRIGLVDVVMKFDSNEELLEKIKLLKPDYMVKGDSWKKKGVVGEEYCKNIIFIPEKEWPYSTTKIAERVLQKDGYLAQLKEAFRLHE
jgi:D-beta-D-heptose 7-phosphate kinase/D-beta-D-heptose 1-phosphate adenosyltransferase